MEPLAMLYVILLCTELVFFILSANWIYLQYSLGDSYNTHCGGEPRKAVILFTCDPSASDVSCWMAVIAVMLILCVFEQYGSDDRLFLVLHLVRAWGTYEDIQMCAFILYTDTHTYTHTLARAYMCTPPPHTHMYMHLHTYVQYSSHYY